MTGAVLGQIQFQERTGEGCVAENGFCPDWIVDNLDKYYAPLVEHVQLTLISLSIGFAIAFALALMAHRRRWLTGPITGITGVMYTIPSVSAFLLLLPLTGRGNLTAIVALVAYTLLILFRNITTGLRNVPADSVDAARGMGLTDHQILWRVELPLALPEILAGLRIALTTTVGLATLAFFAGGGGLGEQIYSQKAGTGGIFFKSNVVVAGGLAVLLAAVGDLLILSFQRLDDALAAGGAGMSAVFVAQAGGADAGPGCKEAPDDLATSPTRSTSSSPSASRSRAASASAARASSSTSPRATSGQPRRAGHRDGPHRAARPVARPPRARASSWPSRSRTSAAPSRRSRCWPSSSPSSGSASRTSCSC